MASAAFCLATYHSIGMPFWPEVSREGLPAQSLQIVFFNSFLEGV